MTVFLTFVNSDLEECLNSLFIFNLLKIIEIDNIN